MVRGQVGVGGRRVGAGAVARLRDSKVDERRPLHGVHVDGADMAHWVLGVHGPDHWHRLRQGNDVVVSGLGGVEQTAEFADDVGRVFRDGDVAQGCGRARVRRWLVLRVRVGVEDAGRIARAVDRRGR